MNIAEKLLKAREDRADQSFRPHLGASRIGAPCSRALWYEFRWCKPAKFDGRMLRLFETGQLAESRFIEELRWIGCEVSEGPTAGEQWRFSAVDGHFGGSMDAAINIDGDWMVCEFKTHNAKSFADITQKGVEQSKPMHYAQMQVYMHLSGMNKALYLAANKDTDALYSEFVEFDGAKAEKLMDRAAMIIYADEPPIGISQDPAFYQCKFCDYSEMCHAHSAPYPTCRNCAHGTADSNGWKCEFKGIRLTVEQQKGCDEHRHIPSLLSNWAEMIDANGHDVSYRNRTNGKTFNNSSGSPNDYSSLEIYHCPGKASIGDPMVEEIRDEFGAKIVEGI